jgi:hypothetical protein
MKLRSFAASAGNREDWGICVECAPQVLLVLSVEFIQTSIFLNCRPSSKTTAIHPHRALAGWSSLALGHAGAQVAWGRARHAR